MNDRYNGRTFTIQFDVVYRLRDLAVRPLIILVDITMTTLCTFVCNYFDIIASLVFFFFSYTTRIIGNRTLENVSQRDVSRFEKIRRERKFR